jgi:5-methylcytosine-specific restriction endonuclease McrA
MKSKYDNYSREELQKIIDNSISIRQVIIKIGLSPNGHGGYITFKKKVKEYSLDITELKKRTREYLKNNLSSGRDKIPLELVTTKDSNYSRTCLKKRLLKDGLLENVCEICGQLPIWNGKPLTLQLDHINGVYNDNRLENLRIVCGHCHSQLETTGTKNIKRKNIKRKKEKLPNKGVGRGQNQIKKFEVTKEELKVLINNNTFVKIGKMFGVSDNAIRKRAKKFQLI